MASRKPRRRATGQDIRLRGGSIQGPPLEAVPRGSVVPGVTVRLGGTIRGPGLMPYPARLVFRAAEPVAPSGDYPNEPTGMTPLFEWNFAGKPPADASFSSGSYGVLLGDGYMQDGTTWDVISDAAAPQSPTGVLRVKYAAGLAPGNGPDGAWYGWETGTNLDYAEMYESGWFKLVGNGGTWQHPGSGFKGLGYWAVNRRGGSDNQIYSVLYGSSSGGAAGSYSTFAVDIRGQGDVSWTKSYNENTGTLITEGVWHQYELRMVCNTPGSDNGILQLWVDGVRVMNYSDVRYRTVTYAEGFFSKSYAPIWGGGGGPNLAADQYIHWDHVYVSAKGEGL